MDGGDVARCDGLRPLALARLVAAAAAVDAARTRFTGWTLPDASAFRRVAVRFSSPIMYPWRMPCSSSPPLDRPVRFLMFKGSYEHPLVKPFAKILGVIPISSDQGPREMIHSLRRATQALQDGELVCIFPEGQMTRIGQMLPFRRGMERIIKGVDVPIIPVNLDGVWGSIFSFSGGRFLWKFPRHLPYPVRVTFGAPLPVDGNVAGGAAGRARSKRGSVWPPQAPHATAAATFLHTARRHPFPLRHGRRANAEAKLFSPCWQERLSSRGACGKRGKAKKWSAFCCRHRYPARW